MCPTVAVPSSAPPTRRGSPRDPRLVSLAQAELEPASPTSGAVYRVRRLVSSARLALDVIASTGSRDMGRSELARRMRQRGHSPVETNEIVVTLLGRGLLTSDDTTLVMTDTGWGVAARRTPSNRVRA